MLNADLIGVGLYTASEAGRLAGVPLGRVRRWLLGYSYRVNGREVRHEPIWLSEIPPIDGALHLGFRDLVELRVVDRFRSIGLSLQQVQKSHNVAQKLLADERPFSSASFKTDGKRLYLEVARLTDEPQLIDLLTKQHSFHSVIQPSLQTVDFENGAAARWWPETVGRTIALDPKRAFGQPILASAGIPTEVLADAYIAEGSFARAAAAFGVSPGDVQAAVRFQQQIAA